MNNKGPRRQHYIPVFYQAGFTDTDERLWMYARKTQEYIKAHPRVICCENELYTIDPEGIRDRLIEERYLGQIDRDAATAIRQMKRKIKLDREWKESFSIFIAFLITRSPAFRVLTTQNYEAMRAEYLRLGFTKVERASQLLESYRRRTGDLAEGITAESLVEDVATGRWRASVTDQPFLEQMFLQVEPLARWITCFDWQILEAPAETGFIVSDYPFVLVPPRENPEAIGFSFPRSVKYFPLTSALCLRMGEPGHRFSYDHVSKQEVRIINQNIAVNSERFIMGPTRVQLEHIIGRSGTADVHLEPRTKVDTLEQGENSALLRFNLWPRRAFFYAPS